MILSQFEPLANHLWQSTFFAAAAGAMTLMLRTNYARTRYWLWLSASIKFLIPLSILIDLGKRMRPAAMPAAAQSGLSSAMLRVSEPFATPAAMSGVGTALPAAPSLTSLIPAVLLVIWTIGFLTLVFLWWVRLQKLRADIRSATLLKMPVDIDIKVLTSPAFSEPGVFGIRKPVLLLPAGIADQLTPLQLQAILAHELCHVRRRDNLTAAIHMLVEAVFWFHPLVWWLGARLMEERERSCDEEVLFGSRPEVYAEGILTVCELYLKSPLPCVAGVTGANLKKRIETIMSNRAVFQLNLAKKTALIGAGLAALGLPLIVGLSNAHSAMAQSQPAFEAASIRAVPNSVDWPPRAGYWVPPSDNSERFQARIQVGRVIEYAYGVRDFQIVGGPGWMKDGNSRFDFEATAGHRAGREEMRKMAQTLLAERFKLRLHRETRETSVYALLPGKDGPKLDEAAEWSNDGRFDIGQGQFIGRGGTMGPFVEILTNNMDRPVVDRTQLTGHYDFTLNFDPAQLPDWRLGPVLPSLLRELGLRLEPQKLPIEMVVIDSISQPSEN